VQIRFFTFSKTTTTDDCTGGAISTEYPTGIAGCWAAECDAASAGRFAYFGSSTASDFFQRTNDTVIFKCPSYLDGAPVSSPIVDAFLPKLVCIPSIPRISPVATPHLHFPWRSWVLRSSSPRHCMWVVAKGQPAFMSILPRWLPSTGASSSTLTAGMV
jgi:hypothetical protein